MDQKKQTWLTMNLGCTFKTAYVLYSIKKKKTEKGRIRTFPFNYLKKSVVLEDHHQWLKSWKERLALHMCFWSKSTVHLSSLLNKKFTEFTANTISPHHRNAMPRLGEGP